MLDSFVMTQPVKLPTYPYYPLGVYWSSLMDRYLRIVDKIEDDYVIEVTDGIRFNRKEEWLRQRKLIYKHPLFRTEDEIIIDFLDMLLEAHGVRDGIEKPLTDELH